MADKSMNEKAKSYLGARVITDRCGSVIESLERTHDSLLKKDMDNCRHKNFNRPNLEKIKTKIIRDTKTEQDKNYSELRNYLTGRVIYDSEKEIYWLPKTDKGVVMRTDGITQDLMNLWECFSSVSRDHEEFGLEEFWKRMEKMLGKDAAARLKDVYASY